MKREISQGEYANHTSLSTCVYYTAIGTYELVLRIPGGHTVITTTTDVAVQDIRKEQVRPGGNPQTCLFPIKDAESSDILILDDRLTLNRRAPLNASEEDVYEK